MDWFGRILTRFGKFGEKKGTGFEKPFLFIEESKFCRLPIAAVATNSALVLIVSFLQFAAFLIADITVVVIPVSSAIKLRSFSL
jgi:hypothetical protein